MGAIDKHMNVLGFLYEFAHKLETAGVEIPDNIRISAEISEEELEEATEVYNRYASEVPLDFKNAKDIRVHIGRNVFYLKKKDEESK